MIQGLEKSHLQLIDSVQNLVIYGKGGFTYNDVWMMSGLERERLSSNLETAYKKEAEAWKGK